MKDRLVWKVIFIFSFLLTIYTINTNLKMPIIEGESRPDFITYGLLFFDFFILLGSFGYAFKIKTLNSKVWKVTIVMFPLLILLETLFDFYAGGYVVYEMITHSLLVFFLTCLLVAPVIMYLNDFKVIKSEN